MKETGLLTSPEKGDWCHVRSQHQATFVTYALFKDHFAAAGLHVAVFADAHTVFVVGGLLTVEGEFVACMGLGDVGYLKAADAVGAIPVEGPEVEHVLNVFHGIDVAIDVDIVIISVYGMYQRGIVSHLHSATLVDGTVLVLDDPLVDSAVVDGKDIGGLACLGVDHCPDGTAVAIDMTVVAQDPEIAGGEVAHGTLHPRLDVKLCVLHGHLVHLDGKAREHPRAVDGEEIFHAEASGRGVEVGGIKHVIAEVPHEEPLREVAMEGLGHEFVRSYLFHFEV